MRFLDATTGLPARAPLETSSVAAVAFDPRGRWLATGHWEGFTRIWDASTLELVKELPVTIDFFDDALSISELGFSPSGEHLARTTTSAVYVDILDVRTWSPLWERQFFGGRMGEPSPLRWSPDGSRLWTAFVSGGMPVYEVELDQQPLKRGLVRGQLPITGAGRIAALLSWSGIAALDTSTGRILWNRVRLGRDGWLLQTAEGYFDSSFDRFEELLWSPPHAYAKEGSEPLTGAALALFDPKRVRAARAGVKLVPRHLPVEHRNAYLRAHLRADAALVGRRPEEARRHFLECLELDPESATLAYGLACASARGGDAAVALEWLERAVAWGYADAAVAAWDEDLALLRGSERFELALEAMARRPRPPPPAEPVRISFAGEERRVLQIVLDPTGTTAGLQFALGGVSLVDIRTGEGNVGSRDPRGQRQIAVLPGGRSCIALSWDGKLQFELPHGAYAVSVGKNGRRGEESAGALLMDPTGERVLAAVGQDAVLYTTAGEHIARFRMKTTSPHRPLLAWSHDGARIAYAEGTRICFLDGRTGKPLADPLETPEALTHLEFEPSGQWLGTLHADASLRLWRTGSSSDAEPVVDEHGLPLSVRFMRFAPAEGHLALITGEGDVLVLETGSSRLKRRVAPPELAAGQGPEIAWSNDGLRLWMASADGTTPIRELELSNPAILRELYKGFVPLGGAGVAVAASPGGGAFAFEVETGRLLWSRIEQTRQASIHLIPEGWFECDTIDLSGLVLFPPHEPGQILPGLRLTGEALKLHDPKRVRASRAGVQLVPIEW